MDAYHDAMNEALRRFRASIVGGDEAVFSYAGHAVELDDVNYLLPTDIRDDNDERVANDALALQRVLSGLAAQKPRFSLVIIDACRDNPFEGKTRNVATRGLVPAAAAVKGQMIIYSAGGNRASGVRTARRSLPTSSGPTTTASLPSTRMPGSCLGLPACVSKYPRRPTTRLRSGTSAGPTCRSAQRKPGSWIQSPRLWRSMRRLGWSRSARWGSTSWRFGRGCGDGCVRRLPVLIVLTPRLLGNRKGTLPHPIE
jgi:hypothetical protein